MLPRLLSVVSKNNLHWIALALVLMTSLTAHAAMLGTLPKGLYIDESSIGLNAALIAQSGKDEHGLNYPVYFESFGEYKNPLYIYSSALLFKLLGVHVFTLRATSLLFFFLLLMMGVFLFCRSVFHKNSIISLYGVTSVSFMPWFFFFIAD